MATLFPSRTVAIEIGGIDIYWYGILYVVAFWLAWWMLPKLQKSRTLSLSQDTWTYVVAWGVAGALIGGRLGYVLFYEPLHYVEHPLNVLALWHGGMSSHGGFIGVGLALWHASRRVNVSVLALADVVVVPAAIGLALGRLGNFINQELFIGADAWYAVAKNVFIAGVCYAFLRNTKVKTGQVAALFLVLYSVSRFFIEFIRIQEWAPLFGLTRGQLLTIPLFAVGVWLWHKNGK